MAISFVYWTNIETRWKPWDWHLAMNNYIQSSIHVFVFYDVINILKILTDRKLGDEKSQTDGRQLNTQFTSVENTWKTRAHKHEVRDELLLPVRYGCRLRIKRYENTNDTAVISARRARSSMYPCAWRILLLNHSHIIFYYCRLCCFETHLDVRRPRNNNKIIYTNITITYNNINIIP